MERVARARQQIGAYAAWGAVGYVAGTIVASSLAAAMGLGLPARLVVTLVPPIVLLLGIKASQFVYGAERIVFYEQAVLAIGAAALAALAVGGPVATTIDLATIGVGVFLAFGRVGCHRVACCYGRRAARGVRYGRAHARAGFPARWIELPLLPIQLVDGALALACAIGATAVVTAASPGVAAVAFAAGYGLGRIGLELARGDALRPRWGGVTEAQGTAVATMLLGALWRPAWWSIAAAVVGGAIILALAVARRADRWPGLWLASAWHVDEVAAAIESLVAHGGRLVTREGMQLSARVLPDGRVDVIASRAGRPLPVAGLRALATQLGRPWSAVDVQPGRTPGLVHLLLTRAPDDPR